MGIPPLYIALFDQVSGGVQAALHSSFRQAQDMRNLAYGIVFDIVKFHGDAVFFVQSMNDFPESIFRPVRNKIFMKLICNRALADEFFAFVDRDADHPALEGFVFAQSVNIAPGIEDGILHRVLTIGIAAKNRSADAVEPVGHGFDALNKSIFVHALPSFLYIRYRMRTVWFAFLL